MHVCTYTYVAKSEKKKQSKYKQNKNVYDGQLSFLSIISILQVQKCRVPPSAPKNMEKVINKCQDEIRMAILSGKVPPSWLFLLIYASMRLYMLSVLMNN